MASHKNYIPEYSSGIIKAPSVLIYLITMKAPIRDHSTGGFSETNKINYDPSLKTNHLEHHDFFS